MRDVALLLAGAAIVAAVTVALLGPVIVLHLADRITRP